MLLCVAIVSMLSLCSSFRPRWHPFIKNVKMLSSGRSLDAELVAKEPGFVLDYIKRRGLPQLESSVERIAEVRAQKIAFEKVYDAARSKRKKLSNDIGTHMKLKNLDTVNALKLEVDAVNAEASEAEASRAALEEELKSLFALFPNLLDDRYYRC